MDSRREFLRKAALLAAGGGAATGLPLPIQRAFAIDPAPGTTWLDAEHIVILMQENRSFDHCYGALGGVRGFQDPRAVTLPNGNPVWLQTNRQGECYGPFRLDLKESKVTWMSSLPHSWVDQTDARRGGYHDGWLEAKRSAIDAYADLPLTLGYFDRRDVPFYYALADAFTVCDQNFCSSLTGTTPNRLHLWTGTIRAQPALASKANVRNEDVEYSSEVSWRTFPELLEDLGVSWRVYQNEIGLESGLEGEAKAWLGNFEDNPLEWFSQYHVRFAATHRQYLREREKALGTQIPELEAQPGDERGRAKLAAARQELENVRRELATFTEEAFGKLPKREQELHRKGLTINSGDPGFREITFLDYADGGTPRRMEVPKGDLLHQFRQDVEQGRLPTVSWIVAPERFSDHPGSPWYGAWYLSECLDILTQNPELWRKTIFVLCYDENDGYFDHVPPFVPPHPSQSGTGKVSAGIDVAAEHVPLDQERERQKQHPGSAMREGPIGLGFRVPLVIASPWSRGGYVNSQVFDHTSILRMLEQFLGHKTGRSVRETNISSWRRTVCGDLTSVFRPYHGEKVALPDSVERDPFLESIHRAQFKGLPSGFRRYSKAEIAMARRDPRKTPGLPRQEAGARKACALPYELAVDGRLSEDLGSFTVRFAAGREHFGDRAAGGAFHVYVPGPAQAGDQGTRAYAVTPGDALVDTWELKDFRGGQYHLRVHGPNGFYREFRGSKDDPQLEIRLEPVRQGNALTGDLRVWMRNHGDTRGLTVRIEDPSYGARARSLSVGPKGSRRAMAECVWKLAASGLWYDLRLRVEGAPAFEQRFAGRVETGLEGVSDPLLSRRKG